MLWRPLATIRSNANSLPPFPLASPAPRAALALDPCQPDFVPPLSQREMNCPTDVWDLLDKEGLLVNIP